MPKTGPGFENQNPEQLTERFGKEMSRISWTFETPTGPRSFVDLEDAKRWLEQAVREAFNHGAVAGLSRAPARIVVEEPPPRIVPVPVYPEGWIRR